ncbi:MAG: Wzz/FepE/Etk N-terminal domain-containing protein [Bacteroidota bacterium]
MLENLSILLRWQKFILINVIVVTLLAIGISLLLPNWYKSTTTLLPPKQSDIFGNLGGASSLLKGIGGLGKLGGLGGKAGAYNYFAILRSRTTMERIITQFNLIEVYDTKNKSMELAIKELEGNVNFEEEVDDNISVQVFDKDPIRAANMANYFVEVLNEINTRLGTQEAKSNREFIEQRLLKCRLDLQNAEDALRAYQEKTGMMIAADENNSSVSAYAELYAMKVKKDVEIAVLQKTVSSDDSYLRQLRLEIIELNQRLDKFPSAGLESFRLYREVITQQRILEFILPVYEQARIDEQKDIPVLLVLDKAVPAEKKSRPQRMLIVFLASVLSLFFFVLIAFTSHGFALRSGEMSSLEQTFHRYARAIIDRYKINLT